MTLRWQRRQWVFENNRMAQLLSKVRYLQTRINNGVGKWQVPHKKPPGITNPERGHLALPGMHATHYYHIRKLRKKMPKIFIGRKYPHW